jgi:hypothetical protein
MINKYLYGFSKFIGKLKSVGPKNNIKIPIIKKIIPVKINAKNEVLINTELFIPSLLLLFNIKHLLNATLIPESAIDIHPITEFTSNQIPNNSLLVKDMYLGVMNKMRI